MTKNGVEQQPSETALLTALRRAIAHKEFSNQRFGPDYLAEYFLPGHFRFFLRFSRALTGIKKRLDHFLPGLTEYMIARTLYFDRLFTTALNDKVPQIVLLGAGYDSRAYRFANANQRTRIFELDIAPTQNRKKKYLKKAKIHIPPEVRFISIDFNREALGKVLEKAGYRHDRKTLFLWEGVTYYLDPESVDTTLAFISSSQQPESAIAFDYTIPVTQDNIGDYYGVKEFIQVMEVHHASEKLVFSIEEEQLAAFLAQQGLKLIEHLDNQEIEKTYLTEGSMFVGQMTGHFRFALASIKKV